AALWIAYLDADGDELGDPASPVEACGAEPGQVANADDCDDTSAALGVERTGYPDADADGFGVEPAATYCDGSSGFADVAGDCDDLASDVFPGAVEACDGVDQNCAAGTDDEPFSTFYLDADADGFGDPATATEACAPEAGWVDDGTDCDDGHASAHPGGEQLCDGLDGDCDGTPLGDGPESAWYADVDGDGRGDDATEVTTACPPEGWVSAGGDCDDADPQRSPDLPEVADDGIDQDCDGVDRVSPEPPPADDTGKPEDPSEGCGCAQVEPGSVWLGVAGALLARFTRRRAAAPPAG
ncbi:MAG: putative metal-binding motif-containing protein, partial [Myxococcota bacterium]